MKSKVDETNFKTKYSMNRSFLLHTFIALYFWLDNQLQSLIGMNWFPAALNQENKCF